MPSPQLLHIRPRRGLTGTPFDKQDNSSDEDSNKFEDNSNSPNSSRQISQRKHENDHNKSKEDRTSVTREKLSITPESAPLHPKESVVHSQKMSFIFKVLCALVAFWFFKSVLPAYYAKDCSFKDFNVMYPEQDPEIWRNISINIKLIIEGYSKSPAVYLFLHERGKRMRKLVKDIAAQTAECFGGQLKLAEMSNNDFTSSDTMQDYGHAIQKFKEKIKDRSVALIVNLNEIPAEAARALHTICDTYTPIADEIIIFLTLVTPPSSGTPKEIAYNALLNMWSSKLKHNDLYALITRVTDQVIAFKNN